MTSKGCEGCTKTMMTMFSLKCHRQYASENLLLGVRIVESIAKLLPSLQASRRHLVGHCEKSMPDQMGAAVQHHLVCPSLVTFGVDAGDAVV